MIISSENHVVIVGAGMGGLSAACDLVARGYAVTVIERHAQVGGKIRTVECPAGPVDSGPTVLTMRWVFEELFAAADRDFNEDVPTQQAHILARHAWSASEQLDLHADESVNARNIEAFAGKREAEGYRAYCQYARNIHTQVFAPFMRAARPSLGTLVQHYGPKLLRALHDIDAFRSMHAAQRTFFRDKRLRQLFGRYATYAGGAPQQAPATLNVIAHVEQQGVWYVQGGMQKLADALCKLARDGGADIRCNTGVERVIEKHGSIVGVVLDNGETLAANAVIFNGEPDAVPSAPSTSARKKIFARSEPAALSAITWSGAATAQGFALSRHNVFFAPNPTHEFEQIFKHERLPTEAPTIYICAQDQLDRAAVQGGNTTDRDTGGPERFLCLINAPATDNHPTQPEIAACQDNVERHLARCGLTLTWQTPPTCTTPAMFAQRFPQSRGAIYGPAPHTWRSFFNRRGSRTRLKGLFLAGGSVHPGPGLPMAALSGRLAAAALAEDFPLTTPCRTTATRGGISTPKATTAATL